MPTISPGYELEIRNVVQRVLDYLIHTLEAHSEEDTSNKETFGSIVDLSHRLLQNPDFFTMLQSANVKNRRSMMNALEQLDAFAHNRRHRVETPRTLDTEFVVALRQFAKTLEALARFDETIDPEKAQHFRLNAATLGRTLSIYRGRSVAEAMKLSQRRLDQVQDEAELLRAQLNTSQTELEIREEQARAAEMRAERLSTHVAQLELALAQLHSKVTEFEGTDLNLRNLILDAEEQKSEITKIRDEVLTLAADAAENVMAANYGAMADEHGRKERFFRWAALSLFASSTVGAALIAWNIGWFASGWDGNSQIELWTGVAKKLLVAGGLAGIGLYLSRLSNHHRKIQVWSSSLGVQLKTLESYLGGIKDEDLKDRIREKFAGLTFGGPPMLDAGTLDSSDAKAVAELATALTSAIRS